MNRRERRQAMLAAGLVRDTRRAIAYYRAELAAGRHHCMTVDLIPWVGLGLLPPIYCNVPSSVGSTPP